MSEININDKPVIDTVDENTGMFVSEKGKLRKVLVSTLKEALNIPGVIEKFLKEDTSVVKSTEIDSKIKDFLGLKKANFYQTVLDMMKDSELTEGMTVVTLGNGIDDALCFFTISSAKKDNLSPTLNNGLYANIIGEQVNLTSLSQKPFQLLPEAVKTYRYIMISGNHTITETVVIDKVYNKCIVDILGSITLECDLFKITQSSSITFKGGIYYGNNIYTLFTVPQDEDADRASFNAEKMILNECTLVNLTNTSGYLRFNKITITEDTSNAFKISGEGLNIPSNFVYFENCSMGGKIEIKSAIDLFFTTCDFVNTTINMNKVHQTIFNSCNFITRGNTNVIDDCKNIKFVGCILETDSTETLFVFKNNCRGVSIDGIAVAGTEQGLLIDSTDMNGYMKLSLKPTYIGKALYKTITIGENVTVDTFFPTLKTTLGDTGRIIYNNPEMNCAPNIVYTIPEVSDVYFDSGYIYIPGEVGKEYIVIASHT